MDQEKYEEVAEKQIETDRFLTELIEAETILGIGVALAIVELQHLLNIEKWFITFCIVLLIGFFVWQMFRLEEEEKRIEESLEEQPEEN
jgi:hypothetical protein